MAYLQSLGPSALELELRSLSSQEELRGALTFFRAQLAERSHVELTQAILAVFLKLHVDSLAADATLLPAVQELQAAQADGWGELRHVLHGNLCMLGFLSRTQT